LPVLSNSRHEKFAQGLAEGKTATEAYENAGYAPNDGNSARPKGNERIRARVAELQGRGAERAAVTLQGLLDEASDIQTKALAKGHYAAAVAALTVRAKLSGLWIDRLENKNASTNYVISDEPLTEQEWIDKFGKPNE
jgi:hypothetical protein